MKYIIVIILLLLIVFFTMKKSIEYRKENLEICDANCGKHTTDGSCLSCENCGVCKLTRRDKIYTYCLPGNKDGAYFNEECKNTTWTYRGDESIPPLETKPKITLEYKPRIYTPTPSTGYDNILKSIGQKTVQQQTVSASGNPIGVTVPEEEKVELIGTRSAISATPKTYNEVLDELERLSAFFKK
jgi:hypothetical protein